MTDARTCVVLVNFNTSKQTLACLNTLANSISPVSVVVVDNCSSNADLAVLESSSHSFSLIKNSVNLGFGGGNNVGIAWALTSTKADYIFVLNNDTLVEADTIALLQIEMDSNLHLGITSPRIMFAEDRNIYWYGGGYLDLRRGGARSDRLLQPFDDDYQSKDVSFVSGCAMLFRRNALLKMGGFDSRFFMYCEDQELCARYIAGGWGIRYFAKSVIYHEGHASIRGAHAGYLSPLDPSSTSLLFYIEHVVAGSLLLMDLWASRWLDKVFGISYLCIRWSRHACRLALHGRLDSLGAIVKGVRRYFRVRYDGGVIRFTDPARIQVT